MKIVILGAGQVGGTLAQNLAGEGNDVTVVDVDARLLQEMRDRLDLRTVQGNATHPDVLKRAALGDADMLIAVTSSDEANMVACQIAYTLFSTPSRIARVRSQEYLLYGSQLFSDEAIPVTALISPENLVTEYVQRLIEHPGALQVLDFAGGRVRLVGVRAHFGSPLVGHELSTLREHMHGDTARVAAIFRGGKGIIPEGDTVIAPNDEVFFVAGREDIRAVIAELRRLEKPVKRIILAGGGNIGLRLAKNMEERYQLKIIECSEQRTRQLSAELDRTIVLNGDAADENLLIEENIDNTDVFCALTNDDEANILSAMLAKRLGARMVMALINRPAYVDLIEGGQEIDVAISPQQATIGTMLAHVRHADMVKVHSLRRGAAEAIEAVAHGTAANSRVVGRRVEQIRLPGGASIGCIVRGDEVLMAHHDTVIESEDHIILFLVDKRRIREVERLFAVGITFV